jgi:cyclopropane fatty-acyl-phospholipid synthase-like methyltransferase
VNQHDEFWRKQATSEDYADANIPTKEQVDFLVNALRPAVHRTNASILEFGCGYGRLTKQIKKAFPAAFVAGVDINANVLAKAREYAGHAKTSREQSKYPMFYQAADIKNVPPKDAIYSVAVLQHMPSDRKRQFFAEAAAALNRAGVLVFQYVEGDSDTFLTHDAKVEDVSKWLRQAGFEIASYEQNLIQDRWTWIVAVKE